MAIYKGSTRKTTTVARPATNTRKSSGCGGCGGRKIATNTRKSSGYGGFGGRKTTTTKRK